MKDKIFITGDIHGDLSRVIEFVGRLKLDETNKIIILGDAGLCWRKNKKDLKYNISLWNEYGRGVHLYFLDGNHENFAILYNLPIDENNMGVISDNIHYLRRGATYTFNNKKVLVCGGADSIDKAIRREGLNWWKGETISMETIDAIPASHYDYVLTHCCPRSLFENNKAYLITLRPIDSKKIDHNSEDCLEILSHKITFDKWMFGHYHINHDFGDGFECLFQDFKLLN